MNIYQKFLMLFKNNSLPQGFQSEIQGALSIFNLAKQDLEDINKRINDAHSKSLEIINTHQKNIGEFESMLNQNTKVIEKIDAIIS